MNAMNDIFIQCQKVTEEPKLNHKRKSRYTGVVKNSQTSWLSAIIFSGKRYFLGSFSNEQDAAKVYDVAQIQCNGIKARTNFSYTKGEIIAMLFERSLIAIREEFEQRRNKFF